MSFSKVGYIQNVTSNREAEERKREDEDKDEEEEEEQDGRKGGLKRWREDEGGQGKERRQREGEREGKRSASNRDVSCNNTIVLYPIRKLWG